MSDLQSSDVILDYWFGPAAPVDEMAKRQAPLWWQKDPERDHEIETRFKSTIRAASAGALEERCATPRGTLSLILLVDQMRRNIYRDRPDAFAADARARAWTESLLTDRKDRELAPLERVFAYLPLEHSESVADQARCVTLYEELRDAADPADRDAVAGYVGFAEAHAKIIVRFGRFPHRNAILGRVSSAEELAFLKEPGSSF